MGSASDSFTRDKFAWQRQVLEDRALPPLALHVGMVISDHVNRASGVAWPGQARIALMLKLDERTVRRLVGALVTNGHIAVKSRHGRGDSNQYSFIAKNRTPAPGFEDEDTGHQRPVSGGDTGHQRPVSAKRNRALDVKETGRQRPPNNLIEQSEDISLFPSSHEDEENTSSGFEEFWGAYPRKTGKLDAGKAYAQVLKKRLATPKQLADGAARYATERVDQDPTFTKYPASWLRAGSWADEPTPAHRPQQQGRAQPFSALQRVAEIFHDE